MRDRISRRRAATQWSTPQRVIKPQRRAPRIAKSANERGEQFNRRAPMRPRSWPSLVERHISDPIWGRLRPNLAGSRPTFGECYKSREKRSTSPEAAPASPPPLRVSPSVHAWLHALGTIWGVRAGGMMKATSVPLVCCFCTRWRRGDRLRTALGDRLADTGAAADEQRRNREAN